MPEQEDKAGERVEVKTAPQLTPELRKKIGVTDADEPEAAPAKPKSAAKKSAPAAKKDSAKTAVPDEPASDEDLMKRSADLEDDRTDEAVKDIVSYEGDVMLAVADSTAEARNQGVEDSDEEDKGRGFFSIVMWTLIIFIVIVAVVAVAVFATGTNVSGLK